MSKNSLTSSEFRAFLTDLAGSGVVRVVGSYAAATENTQAHTSDLDLYILREDEGMKKVIAIYEKHGVKWESAIVGHISSPRDLVHLPFPVECSYLFSRCKRKETFTLNICGVDFKAYRQ